MTLNLTPPASRTLETAFRSALEAGDRAQAQRLMAEASPTVARLWRLQAVIGWGDRDEGAKLIQRLRRPTATHVLLWAAQNNHAWAVALLMPKCDPAVFGDAHLCWAVMRGHAEVVRVLLSGLPPGGCRDANPLRNAVIDGRVDLVAMLLPFCGPQWKDSMCLHDAAVRGNVALVQTLLPLSQPQAQGSQALSAAASAGHTAVVALLAPVSDVGLVWTGLLQDHDWDGADTLAAWVPMDMLRADLPQAPLDELPHARARAAALGLDAALPQDTPAAGVLSRLRL